MGLTIGYEMRLPGNTPEAKVAEILERLRNRAETLDLMRISLMYRLSLDNLQQDRAHSWTSLDYYFFILASGVLRARDNNARYDEQPNDRVASIGFAVHPGEGCEAAGFGFVRPLLSNPPQDAESPTDWNTWCWYGWCKTQYASAVSDEHFVQCHLTIVELLEEAIRLGVDVTVYDEGGYWETRSTDHLLREVEKMNRLVAAFGGALHDAISPENKVEGAIFEHPDFERLETQGRLTDF